MSRTHSTANGWKWTVETRLRWNSQFKKLQFLASRVERKGNEKKITFERARTFWQNDWLGVRSVSGIWTMVKNAARCWLSHGQNERTNQRTIKKNSWENGWEKNIRCETPDAGAKRRNIRVSWPIERLLVKNRVHANCSCTASQSAKLSSRGALST